MPVRKLLLTPPATYLEFSAITAAERSNDKDMSPPERFEILDEPIAPTALFQGLTKPGRRRKLSQTRGPS
jgi:hypothetical protein